MASIDGLLAELEQESKTTRRVLERVPNDHLGWKPHPKSCRSGNFPGQFNQPHGIAVDSTGNIYIAENRGRRIHKFTIATR